MIRIRQTAIVLIAMLALALAAPPAQGQDPLPTAQPLPTATPRPTAVPLPLPTVPPAAGLDATIAANADADLQMMRLAIGRAQLDYQRANGGKLWQAAPTHTRPPVVGDRGPQGEINPLARPLDGVAWHDLNLSIPADLLVSVRVDTYEGPGGSGYVVVGEFEHAGRTWQRMLNVGPETWRESNWSQR